MPFHGCHRPGDMAMYMHQVLPELLLVPFYLLVVQFQITLAIPLRGYSFVLFYH